MESSTNPALLQSGYPLFGEGIHPVFGPEPGFVSVEPFKQEGTRRPGLCQQQRSAKSFIRRAAAAAFFALVLAPHPAPAMTADGALMTNTAFATFSGIAGQAVSYKTSYLASANVLICNPLILYVKTATPSMAAPTAVVTFTVCTINNSTTTSAFNVVITDQIPGNMAFIAEKEKWPLPVTSVWGPSVSGPWSGAAVPAGQVSSFLQWQFSQINVGPGKSACVTYTASIL
jgi:uncharacterized repeat protein (TIGR01451 family)